jgi:riboflavin kinase/FMN adenylyltransferase
MRILASHRNLKPGAGPYAVALGIFDGVHIGHRELLARVRQLAARDGIDSLAYTFNPHPAALLVPDRAPELLEPIENRLDGLAQLGLKATLVERFDHDFASMPAEEFVGGVLVDKLRARHVVVGDGFTFGAGGGGNTALLASCPHFETHVVPPVTFAGQVVSSTRIRTLVAEGRVREAASLLGRPFTLHGLVVRGHMRGQGLGFPTANIDIRNEIAPGRGVFAGRAFGAFGSFSSVVNVGYTPTFGDAEALKVEAHLLDFEPASLYGQNMSLELIAKLRNEQKFVGPEALVAQIERDIASARGVLRG